MESGRSFPDSSSYWISVKWINETHHIIIFIYTEIIYLWWEHVVHPGVKPASGAWLWSACRHPIVLKTSNSNQLNNIIVRNPYWESETLNGVDDIVERGLPSINPSYPTDWIHLNLSPWIWGTCIFFLTSLSLPIHSLCSPLETECWSLHTRTV